MEKFGKRNLKVTKEHNEDCKRLLRLLGVPVVEAPCEAEATCAELCKQGKVYAVATEDMDTLTFGSPKLAKNMMKPQGAQLPVTEISYDKALEELKLTKEQFVDMCILCGCDYTDSVRGCGPVTALKLIQEYGSLEGAMEELQSNKKYTLPESFPYEEARRLFLQPDVVDVASMPEFKWTDPDEEGLVAVRRIGDGGGCLVVVCSPLTLQFTPCLPSSWWARRLSTRIGCASRWRRSGPARARRTRTGSRAFSGPAQSPTPHWVSARWTIRPRVRARLGRRQVRRSPRAWAEWAARAASERSNYDRLEL